MIQENSGFALGNIRISQFALFEENRSPIRTDEYLILTEVDVALSMEQQGVVIILGYTFEQDDKPNIKLETITDFHIAPSTWDSFISGNTIIVPMKLIRRFTEICIGTARGILTAKTRDTEFHDFLLPLMDVNQLIVEDSIFSLEEE